MGFFDFFSPDKLTAAHNAILAQHLSKQLNTEQKHLFKEKIDEIMQSGSGGAGTKAFRFKHLNDSDKLVQLNLIALAAIELGYSPTLKGGTFMPIKNPFRDKPNTTQLDMATEQVQRANPHEATNIEIDFNKINFNTW